MAATNSWKKNDLIRQNRNLVTKAASHRRRRRRHRRLRRLRRLRRCRFQPLPRFPFDFKTSLSSFLIRLNMSVQNCAQCYKHFLSEFRYLEVPT